MWIALFAAPAGHVWYALGAFVLFRLFDIFKPLGIPGPYGKSAGWNRGNDGRYSVRSLRIYNFDCGKMDNPVEIKWQRCVVAPFCLDLLQGPDFCAILQALSIFCDYPSGKGFCCFYLYATFTGSVVGGIVAVNYGWVFHAEDCKENACCREISLCLGRQHYTEYLGHFALTEWLTGMTWVNGLLGYYIDNVFILSKIIVAVLVAFWNYHLQRFFSFIVITI